MRSKILVVVLFGLILLSTLPNITQAAFNNSSASATDKSALTKKYAEASKAYAEGKYRWTIFVSKRVTPR